MSEIGLNINCLINQYLERLNFLIRVCKFITYDTWPKPSKVMVDAEMFDLTYITRTMSLTTF